MKISNVFVVGRATYFNVSFGPTQAYAISIQMKRLHYSMDDFFGLWMRRGRS